MTEVLSGSATFGISDSSIVLQRMQGKPVVVLSAIFQHSPLVLITLKDAGIKSPHDLIGKRVSYQKTIDGASITAMFLALGIEPEQYTHVPYTFNDDILLDGDADAFSAYVTNQPEYYREQGADVMIIDPMNYGIDFYGDMIFTSQEYVENNPEKAKAFVEASIKGWAYALEHPEVIIDYMRNNYESEKSLNLLRYEAKTTKPLISPSVIPIGTTFKQRFQRIATTYYELGLAKQSVSLDGLMLEDYFKKRASTYNPKYLIFGIGLIFVLLVITIGFNRQLQQRVRSKTIELQQLNEDLQSNFDLIEEKNIQLEIVSKSKSVFVANMSHEIRTPLNGIYGSLQLLKGQSLTEEGKELVHNAMSSSVNLLAIINDILDFSKIEAGKLTLETHPFNLVELIKNTQEQLSVLAKQKQIHLRVTIEDGFEPFRLGDTTRIRQVLINILSNAIKFTEQGTVSLYCASDKASDNVVLTIVDTGIGMDNSALSRLFDQFEQADTSTTRKHGGTGLGMSICSTLVELMKGKIDVQSELGVGTKFVVELPLPVSQERLNNHEIEQQTIPDLSHKTILVAEDNRINQLIIKKMISLTNANFQLAENGKEALSLYEFCQPDLILMDIQMPEMDGVMACKYIRMTNQDIPIIALTANVMSNDVAEYLASGFNGHIGKPIDQNQLYEALSQNLF